MIQSLEVKGLNNRFDYEFPGDEFPEFFPDFNLFTGTIGTGKTTLLKLIWYLTSGNLQRVIYEIPFQSVSIKTSQFSLSMDQTDSNQFNLNYQFTELENRAKFVLDKRDSTVVLKQLEELNENIASVMGSSLFFPTFRRMERNLWKDISQYTASSSKKTIDDASTRLAKTLSDLAEELSVNNHKFIAAVSTYDLIELLADKYHEICDGRDRVDDEYATLIERWEELNQFVTDIFTDYRGIRVSENIILGADKAGTRNVIPSSNLSSGEKQLLGFLCYNGFFDVKTIFIDELELSLHPDWQRLLPRILRVQGTEKQFFVATHSTHIAVKYSEYEFKLLKKSGGNV